jgi:ABC-type transport system substrate-binding protein
MKWTLASGVLIAAMVVGCGKGNFSDKGTEAKSTSFRYPIVTSPTTLDPAMVQDGDTIDAVQQVFEGLVGWSADNQPEPRLAESVEVSTDGLTYTFKLRPGIKFSSGRAVTAKDFKDCFERACDPKFNSPTAATYLSDIMGVKERLAGKATEVTGYTAPDDQTVVIKIDKPRPYFLGKLTYPAAFVYDLSKIATPAKEMTNITEMVGTGPYVFSEYVPDQILRFKANPDYFGGAPKIAGIDRPIVKDANTRLNLFKQGEVDMVPLERQDLPAVEGDASLKSQLKFFDRPVIWYLGMNCNVYEPFKKKEVRQAVGMAIDIDDIVKTTLNGNVTRATGIVPKGVFGYQEQSNMLKFDPVKARDLLAKAGYPGGKGLPKFELNFREARPDIQIVAARIASDLKKNLGMDVSLRSMEWRAYLEKHNKKEMPFFHMRWGADYLDAENFLSTLLASYGPENKVNYVNPEYDALCAKADTTADPAERLKLYAQAQDIVLQDAPFIPIYFQRDAELISPRVKGLRESLFGHLPHTTVSME